MSTPPMSSTLQESDFENCASMLAPDFDPSRHQWDFIKEVGKSPGSATRIYRKLHKPSGLYRYLAVGLWEGVKPIQMLATACDLEFRKTWDHLTVDLRRVVDLDDGSHCIYWQCKYPGPITNRDYLFWRRTRYDEKLNAYMIINKSVAAGSLPQDIIPQSDSKYIRVDPYLSYCAMTERDGCLFFGLLLFADPKFKLPKKLVNWIASNVVPDFVKKNHASCLAYPQDKLPEWEQKLRDANESRAGTSES